MSWRATVIRSFILAGLLALAGPAGGCLGGGGDGDGVPQDPPSVTVTAGIQTLDAETQDTVSGTVDLARLGLSGVSATYDLTTPADLDFAFNLLGRNPGNAGNVRFSVAHALDNGSTPTGGAESILSAGIVPSGSRLTHQGLWLEAEGDGFVRLTVQGQITGDQVLAFRVASAAGERAVLVRVRIGPISAINPVDPPPDVHAGILESLDLYSSPSGEFGLPTVAVSGDRISVVVYEGDRARPEATDRYEMRMQVDRATGAITGGGSEEANPDSGHWRDHEIAALYNVLAVVSCGAANGVRVRLSFDRGATFGQDLWISDPEGYSTHLVQTGMAPDYTLAVAYWRSRQEAHELVLVEAQPTSFDAFGSPTSYALGSPQVLAVESGDVTPAIMGVQYSAGGDLVIGYGMTIREIYSQPGVVGGTIVAVTRYHCAVRLFGDVLRDTLVAEVHDAFTLTPSVALLGQGPSLNIWYSCEAPPSAAGPGIETATGVRLYHSADAGLTFSDPVEFGDWSATISEVFVRMQGAETRVDVIYQQFIVEGWTLCVAHWDDFGSGAPAIHRLTEPVREGTLTTEVNWLGFDACLDGDDVVIVYDEVTRDQTQFLGGDPTGPAAPFVPAEPPPLAPGMTEPLPAPDSAHAHQLKMLRLD